MSKAKPLTKNPTLLTAVLSLAALAGYVSYRLTLGVAEKPAAVTLEKTDGTVLADSLPDIVLDDLDGKPKPLASFAGKPMVINFWATWCAPCRQEIPLLKSFNDETPSIQIVGIAVDHLDDVLDYAKDAQFNYPILVGESEGMQAMVTLHNDLQVMPFTVFTGPDGAVLGNHPGLLAKEQLDNFKATIDALAAGRIDRAGARERLAGLR